MNSETPLCPNETLSNSGKRYKIFQLRRSTPLRNTSKKVNAVFKSPMRIKDQSSKNADPESLNQEIEELKKKDKELDDEIQKFKDEGYDEMELQLHISKLHEYNEIKDVAQMVLGRIAVLESVTSRDLYERFGLSLED